MYRFYNSSPEPTSEQDSQYLQLLPHSSINLSAARKADRYCLTQSGCITLT